MLRPVPQANNTAVAEGESAGEPRSAGLGMRSSRDRRAPTDHSWGQEQSTALPQAHGKPQRGGKIHRHLLVLTVSVQEGREGAGGSEGSRTFLRALSDGLDFVGMSRHTHCREAILFAC